LAVGLADCWLYICFISLRNDGCMSSKYARKLANESVDLGKGIKLSSKALDLAKIIPDNGGSVVLPCADKMAFDAQKPANIAAMVAEYQHGAKLKSYACVHCGLWHLASA
jgi:hypothetical protein